jgi:hypothetical protein
MKNNKLLQDILKKNRAGQFLVSYHRGPDLEELVKAELVELVFDGDCCLGYRLTGRGFDAALGKAKS